MMYLGIIHNFIIFTRNLNAWLWMELGDIFLRIYVGVYTDFLSMVEFPGRKEIYTLNLVLIIRNM